MAIRIITDSSSDISQEDLKSYPIQILPLIILDGDKERLDDTKDITIEEIYDGMRHGKFYKTAQLSVTTMRDAFEDAAKAGDDAVFLPLSSGISGTFNTARLIAQDVMEEYPGVRIEVCDTKGATGGQGMMVVDAAKDVAAGKTMEEVLDHIAFNVVHIQYLFTADDIEYLHRGGRVNGIEKILGSLLQIKPVLHINNKGELIPLTKVRGRQKAYQKIAELMGERCDENEDLKDKTVLITHTDAPEYAEKMKQIIVDMYGTTKINILPLRPTVGAHLGPGAVCVFFYDKEYHGFGDGQNLTEEDFRK